MTDTTNLANQLPAQTPAQLLVKAKAVIALPHNWVKRAGAVDSTGFSVDPLNRNACKFCSLGAIRLASASDSVNEEARVFLRLAATTRNIADWNDYDSTTHADVMAAFDTAIALAAAKEHSL